MDLEQAIYQTLPKTALAEKVKNENLLKKCVSSTWLTRAKEKVDINRLCERYEKRLDEWGIGGVNGRATLACVSDAKKPNISGWVIQLSFVTPRNRVLKQER